VLDGGPAFLDGRTLFIGAAGSYVRDPYPVPPVKRTARETDTPTAAFWVAPRTYDKNLHAIVVKPRVELTMAELDQLR